MALFAKVEVVVRVLIFYSSKTYHADEAVKNLYQNARSVNNTLKIINIDDRLNM
jgi:hypothetical protein